MSDKRKNNGGRRELTPEQIERRRERLRNHPACIANRQKGHKGTGALLYTPELADEFCFRIARGQTMFAAIQGLVGCQLTIYKWLRQYPEFRAKYDQARADRADSLLDEAIDTARNGTPKTAALTGVQAGVYLKAASLSNAKKYGKNVQIEHSGEIKTGNSNLESLSDDELMQLRELRLKIDAAGNAGRN